MDWGDDQQAALGDMRLPHAALPEEEEYDDELGAVEDEEEDKTDASPIPDGSGDETILLAATPTARKVMSAYQKRYRTPDAVERGAWTRLEAEMASVGSASLSSDYDRYYWQKVHNANRVRKLCRYFSGLEAVGDSPDAPPDGIYRAKSLPALAVSDKWRPGREWGLSHKQRSVNELRRQFEARDRSKGSGRRFRASPAVASAPRAQSCTNLEQRSARSAPVRADAVSPRPRHEASLQLAVSPDGYMRSPASMSMQPPASMPVRSPASMPVQPPASIPVPPLSSIPPQPPAYVSAHYSAPVSMRPPASMSTRPPASIGTPTLSEASVPGLVRSPEWVARAEEMRKRRETREREKREATDAYLRSLPSVGRLDLPDAPPLVIESVQTTLQRATTTPAALAGGNDPRRHKFQVERRPIAGDFEKNRSFFEAASAAELLAQGSLRETDLDRVQTPTPQRPSPVAQRRTHGGRSPTRAVTTLRCSPKTALLPDPEMLNPYGDEKTVNAITISLPGARGRGGVSPTPETERSGYERHADSVYKYVKRSQAPESRPKAENGFANGAESTGALNGDGYQAAEEDQYRGQEQPQPYYRVEVRQEPQFASLERKRPQYASMEHVQPHYVSVDRREPQYGSMDRREPRHRAQEHQERQYRVQNYQQSQYRPQYRFQERIESPQQPARREEPSHRAIDGGERHQRHQEYKDYRYKPRERQELYYRVQDSQELHYQPPDHQSSTYHVHYPQQQEVQLRTSSELQTQPGQFLDHGVTGTVHHILEPPGYVWDACHNTWRPCDVIVNGNIVGHGETCAQSGILHVKMGPSSAVYNGWAE